MSLRITEKSYPSQFPRPNTEVEIFEKDHLLLVVTPWGTRDGAKQMSQTLGENYGTGLADPDATSPFAKLQGLSSSANSLRVSTLVANNLIFERFNKLNYTTGCEAFVMAQNHSEINWVQVGQPHVILFRKETPYLLQAGFDLTMDFPNKVSLPSKLLGIDRQLELETKSLVSQAGDVIVLLSRPFIPPGFFSGKFDTEAPSRLSEQLFDLTIADNPELAFWLGIVTWA